MFRGFLVLAVLACTVAHANVNKLDTTYADDEANRHPSNAISAANGKVLFYQRGNTVYQLNLANQQISVLADDALLYSGPLLTSFDGGRVGYFTNYTELTVLDTKTGKRTVYSPQGGASGPTAEYQISASGKFVMIPAGTGDGIDIFNVENGTQSTLHFDSFSREVEVSRTDDLLLVHGNNGKMSIYNLVTMTSVSATQSDFKSWGIDSCIPVTAETAYCWIEGPKGDRGVGLLNFSNFTYTIESPKVDRMDRVNAFKMSPSGRYLYFYIAGNYAPIESVYQKDLSTGQTNQLFAAINSSLDDEGKSIPVILSNFSVTDEGLYFGSNATNLVADDQAPHFSLYHWKE